MRLVDDAWKARRSGRLADAERGLAKAIDVARTGGSRRDLIRALAAMSHLDRDLGRSERAERHLVDAVRMCREEGDPLLLAHTIRHLGDVYRESARVDEAQGCYEEALSLYEGNRDTTPLDHANALRPMALLLEGRGDTAAARTLWSRARALYAAASVAAGVAECDAHLSRPA